MPLLSFNHPENWIPAFSSQNITIKIVYNIFAAKLKFLTHLSFNSQKFLVSNLLVDFFNFICLLASSIFLYHWNKIKNKFKPKGVIAGRKKQVNLFFFYKSIELNYFAYIFLICSFGSFAYFTIQIHSIVLLVSLTIGKIL